MQPSTEDIVALTQFVWESVLHLSADVDGAPLASGAVVAGSVSINGPWTGTVTVACPESLATTIASRMYRIDPAAATTVEVDDAVGEIANMIGGNIKAMLPGPSSLSLPSVVHCSASRACQDAELATRWAFATDGQLFSVSMAGTLINGG